MPLTPSQLASLSDLIADHPDAREAMFGPWRHPAPPAHTDLIKIIKREMEADNGTSRR